MKKSFTLFTISALFLMLLFPVSVKAECTNALNLDIYYDRVIPSSCPTGEPSGLHWNHNYYGVEEDDYFWDWKNTTGELYYKITLNGATTCTFSISLANSNNAWMNIYSAGTGDDQCVVGGETYHKLSYHSLNSHNYSQSFNTETVSSVYLSEGTYIISIYGEGNTSMRSISITALDNVFCEPACTKHTVTLTAGAHGSVSGGGEQCEGSITVTATPNSGYRFVNWTNTSTGAEVFTNAVYTFTLSADISLTANFEVNPCTNTKTIQCETDRIIPTTGTSAPNNLEIITSSHHYSGYHGDGYCDFKGSDGELYYLFRAPSSTYNFTVYLTNVSDAYMNIYTTNSEDKCDETTITYGGTTYYKKSYHHLDGPTGDNAIGYRTVSSVSLNGTYIIGLYGKSWTVYDQVVIEASTDVFCPNTITMAKSGDDGAAAPTAQVNSSNVTTAFEGVEVTVTAGEPSDANHYFSGWTVLPENAVTFANPANATTTFSMPASDVTITANYGAVVSSELTFSAVEGGSITSATAGGNAINSGAEVISGTSVTLTAGANSNYVFINWTDDNNSDAVVSTNAAFTFSMPATATAYTANFAQIDNVITVGSESGSSTYNSGASMEESHMDDFGTFEHNVLKLSYSNMTGSNYHGWNIGKSGTYNSASSAGATGFGFYYKTETDEDKVAFCFDHGDQYNQYKVELPATNNVWKYRYIATDAANGWNGSNIIIYINGKDGDNETANASGAIYIADIAATTITSKDDIEDYHYTNNRGGAMQVNEYGTLCLPMAGTISGATLYSVAGKETGDISYLVLEDKGTSVEAGKPYITQSTATSYTVTMNGAHSDLQDGNGLVGTYELINPLTPYNESGPYNYVLNANTFKKAGTDVTVGAYRAYLNLDAVGAVTPAPGARRIRMVIEGTNSATGLEDLINDQLPVTSKVLIDGQLFIIREGKRYTLTGARAQ